MHSMELDNWGRFGKVRLAEEKRLRDPADVLIHAEEYKRSPSEKTTPIKVPIGKDLCPLRGPLCLNLSEVCSFHRFKIDHIGARSDSQIIDVE